MKATCRFLLSCGHTVERYGDYSILKHLDRLFCPDCGHTEELLESSVVE